MVVDHRFQLSSSAYLVPAALFSSMISKFIWSSSPDRLWNAPFLFAWVYFLQNVQFTLLMCSSTPSPFQYQSLIVRSVSTSPWQPHCSSSPLSIGVPHPVPTVILLVINIHWKVHKSFPHGYQLSFPLPINPNPFLTIEWKLAAPSAYRITCTLCSLP